MSSDTGYAGFPCIAFQYCWCHVYDCNISGPNDALLLPKLHEPCYVTVLRNVILLIKKKRGKK